MKKTLAILALAIGIGGISQAGDKGVIAPPPPVSAPACYGAGYEFGIFGAGIFPNTGPYDDEIGGGISLGYFFDENFGIDVSAAWYDTDSVVHNYTVDAVYRIPMDCIAPYVLVGGGVHANSHTEGLFRFGGGIDFRLWERTSLFADAAYNLLGGDVPDYATARVGLRFGF